MGVRHLPKGLGPSRTGDPKSEGLQGREHFLVVRLIPGIVQDLPVPDGTGAVDDENSPFGDPVQPNHVLVEHVVGSDDLLIEVAQERKSQLLRVVKRLQGEERIDTDTVYLGARMVESRKLIAERAQLLLTDRAERGREEGQYHRMTTLSAQGDGLPLVIHQSKVRRGRSNVYTHRECSRFGLRPGTTTDPMCFGCLRGGWRFGELHIFTRFG